MPQFAANLSMMFTEVPFLERFKAAAASGFNAVEYLFPYEYPAELLAEKLAEHQLKQVLFNTAPGQVTQGEWGLTAIPGREAEARIHIQQAFDYAVALNCPNVHVMAGVVPQGEQYDRYWQTFLANIRFAAELFATKNIGVCLEALSPVVKPDYLFSSQYQVLEVVKTINLPNVFMQIDLFHAQIVDGNLTRLLESCLQYCAHIQIASVPERHEPDEGEINYPFLFSLLDKLGYQGWIGCEYHPRGNTVEGLTWLANYQ